VLGLFHAFQSVKIGVLFSGSHTNALQCIIDSLVADEGPSTNGFLIN